MIDAKNAKKGGTAMGISYNNLFKLLIDRGWSKTEFARKVGISSNTLAKLSKNEPVSLDGAGAHLPAAGMHTGRRGADPAAGRYGEAAHRCGGGDTQIMSQTNANGATFMEKLSTFIVDKRNLIFLITIIGLIFSAFSVTGPGGE